MSQSQASKFKSLEWNQFLFYICAQWFVCVLFLKHFFKHIFLIHTLTYCVFNVLTSGN